MPVNPPDDERPAWQKWGALLLVLVFVAGVVLGRSRWGADFWPLDRSYVGPNIVASVLTWIVVVIVGVLLWPPTRRRLHAFADRKLATIHVKHGEHAAKLDHLLRRVEALHDKHDARR